jgi:anthranilate phosphoribosyltransferase
MTTEELVKSAIGRIATGPTLSKDLETEETTEMMRVVLRGETSPVRQALFLIALRMKIETRDENRGILNAIKKESITQNVNVENLVDIGDPYSGYDRSLPVSSFLPPLLAELGLPSIIHSLKSVSPKFGLTHHLVYKELGLNPLITSDDAKLKIEDKNIGWSYIDQSVFCKGLHDLVPLRDDIIKRSVINTVETLTKPFSGKKTHSILGYVHKPYPPKYADLADVSGYDTSLLIRGVEGGVVPSMRQKGLMISYNGIKEVARVDIEPKDLGINRDVRSIVSKDENVSEMAKRTAELGFEAISGKNGEFYDGLVLSASLILWHTKQTKSLVEAADLVRSVLDGGKTINRIK